MVGVAAAEDEPPVPFWWLGTLVLAPDESADLIWWPGALALAPDESADLIWWPGALALPPDEPLGFPDVETGVGVWPGPPPTGCGRLDSGLDVAGRDPCFATGRGVWASGARAAGRCPALERLVRFGRRVPEGTSPRRPAETDPWDAEPWDDRGSGADRAFGIS